MVILPYPRMGFIPSANKGKFFSFWTNPFPNLCGKLLFVQNGPQDGNSEMGEVRGTLIKLQPSHHAMVGEVLRYFRFWDSQVFRELWLDGVRAAAVAAAY